MCYVNECDRMISETIDLNPGNMRHLFDDPEYISGFNYYAYVICYYETSNYRMWMEGIKIEGILKEKV